MKLRAFLALLCVVNASFLFAEELSPAGKKELQNLAGDWRVVSVQQDGKPQETPAELQLLRIEGEKLLIGEKRDRDIGLRITLLDPETKPRIINIAHPETKKTLEGIYEIENNRWRFCLNAEGTAERPSTYETEGKAKYITVTLEREAK